jgi:hypothetical protein
MISRYITCEWKQQVRKYNTQKEKTWEEIEENKFWEQRQMERLGC